MNENFNPAEHLTTISKWRKVKDPSTNLERWVEEKTLYLENFVAEDKEFMSSGELGAIGRALSYVGFGSQFCDKSNKDGSFSDSPIKTTDKPLLLENKTPSVPDASTIYKTAARKGLLREDTDLLINIRYQQDNAEMLSNDERLEFYKGLQENSKERLQNFVSRVKVSLLQEPEQVA